MYFCILCNIYSGKNVAFFRRYFHSAKINIACRKKCPVRNDLWNWYHVYTISDSMKSYHIGFLFKLQHKFAPWFSYRIALITQQSQVVRYPVVLVSLLLILNIFYILYCPSVFIVNFKHLIAGWLCVGLVFINLLY